MLKAAIYALPCYRGSFTVIEPGCTHQLDFNASSVAGTTICIETPESCQAKIPPTQVLVIQSCLNYDTFALFTVLALTKTILHIDKYNKCISKNIIFTKALSVQIKSICANFFKWL